MLKSFKHAGLKKLYQGDESRINPSIRGKVARVLAALDAAESPFEMALPGYRLHPLKGERASVWSVSVSGNWRITFRFKGSDCVDVDLVDYH